MPMPGYWDPMTATVDWCEANYAVTYYIAEFWNTISSYAISVVGLIALYICYKYKLERRLFVLQALVVVIGLGSALFHGTLLFHMQMWDEIPMVWALLSWFYLLFQLQSPYKVGNKTHRIVLTGYAISMALIHIIGGFTTAFQVHFVLLILFGFWKARNLPKVSSEFDYMSKFYLAMFLIAGACWLTDKFFCHQINRYLFFNPQLHAFWHLFMAFNVHFGTQYSTALRLAALNMSPRTVYIIGSDAVPLRIAFLMYRPSNMNKPKLRTCF